jgi:hypothetical protein
MFEFDPGGGAEHTVVLDLSVPACDTAEQMQGKLMTVERTGGRGGRVVGLVTVAETRWDDELGWRAHMELAVVDPADPPPAGDLPADFPAWPG